MRLNGGDQALDAEVMRDCSTTGGPALDAGNAVINRGTNESNGSSHESHGVAGVLPWRFPWTQGGRQRILQGHLGILVGHRWVLLGLRWTPVAPRGMPGGRERIPLPPKRVPWVRRWTQWGY